MFTRPAPPYLPKSAHLPGGIVDEPPQRVVPPLKAQALISKSPWSIGCVSVCSINAVT